MTQISKEDVLYLAQLSSLQLDDDEVRHLQTDLDNIISNINRLDELAIGDVEPTYQVTDLENVWRDDTVDNYGLSRDSLLALSSDIQDDQIKVPKVL